MATQPKSIRPQAKYLIGLLLLVILLYVVVPQLSIFKQTPTILKQADPVPVVMAVLFSALTYFAAAGNYYFLAFKKLSYLLTVLVQYGAMFINRLLPAGIGTMGVNFLYLKNKRHTNAQATAIIGTNNLITFISNSLIILACIIFLPDAVNLGNRSVSSTSLLFGILLVVAAIMAISFLVGRKKFKKFFSDVMKSLLSYKSHPQKLFFALLSSALITIFNSLAFMYSLQALGISLSFAAIVLILSFGVSAGAATPTPGGLGGFEAGLAAALIAYGIDKPSALAAALLYRLISYWLMFVFGGVAFLYSQKSKLLLQ